MTSCIQPFHSSVWSRCKTLVCVMQILKINAFWITIHLSHNLVNNTTAKHCNKIIGNSTFFIIEECTGINRTFRYISNKIQFIPNLTPTNNPNWNQPLGSVNTCKWSYLLPGLYFLWRRSPESSGRQMAAGN